MKVCYVVNQYPKVSHSFIRREIIELERQGLSVSRISMRGWDDALVDPDDLAEREKTHFVLREPVWRLALAVLASLRDSPRGVMSAAAMCLRLMRRSYRPWPLHFVYLVEACVVARRLRADAAEHMHAHFGTNGTEVALLAHLITGVPFSFTVHGPDEFDKPEYMGLSQKIEHAAFVCAISSFGRGQLYRWAREADWPKITVVRCGLDQRFTAPPPQGPLPARRLVCVGRICKEKGQLLLVEAAARLAREGIPFEIVLAGDGDLRAEVERRAERLGIGDRVKVTGWISAAEVREQILAARALVLPSFAEGIPVVLMEAMALQRPVITTYVAGIPELVVPAETGWLIPSGSIDDLTASMRACLAASDEQLAGMGRAGRQRVLELHHITTECARLAEAMRLAAARRRLPATSQTPLPDHADDRLSQPARSP